MLSIVRFGNLDLIVRPAFVTTDDETLRLFEERLQLVSNFFFSK